MGLCHLRVLAVTSPSHGGKHRGDEAENPYKILRTRDRESAAFADDGSARSPREDPAPQHKQSKANDLTFPANLCHGTEDGAGAERP